MLFLFRSRPGKGPFLRGVIAPFSTDLESSLGLVVVGVVVVESLLTKGGAGGGPLFLRELERDKRYDFFTGTPFSFCFSSCSFNAPGGGGGAGLNPVFLSDLLVLDGEDDVKGEGDKYADAADSTDLLRLYIRRLDANTI